MTVLTFKIWLTCLLFTVCCVPLDEYRGKHRRKVQTLLFGLFAADIMGVVILVLMGIWL